jgi:hypothetical protein
LFELHLEVPFTLEEWLAFGPIRDMARRAEAPPPSPPFRPKPRSPYAAPAFTLLLLLLWGYLRLA